MARSALAPKLRTLLLQAVQPDEDYFDSIDDILRGLKQLDAQREVAAAADLYYDGDVGMVWASEKVRQLLERQGVEDIHDFNYAKIPVDVVANRLAIASVAVEPAEENEDGQDKAEKDASEAAKKALAQLRKDNQLDAEEDHLHHKVSKHGNAYLLVWPDVQDGKVAGVDIRVNSAHVMTLVYDEEDPLVPAYALKSWETEVDGQPVVRANLYYFGEGKDGRIERWATEPGSDPQAKEAWRKLVNAIEDLDGEDPQADAEALLGDEFADEEDTGEDIPNPWGQIVFHFRTDRPIGIPEHKSAYGPQEMINKLIYAHAGTIDYQSFPQRYQLVDPMQDDPLQNLADPDHPEDEDDDPETDAGRSGLRADPATIWRLYGKSVGEFQAADPSVFMTPLDRYVKAMAELTDVPQHAFTKASADMPSGDAVRALNGPLNTKVLNRRRRYEAVWQDAYELALHMLGIDGVTVDIRWAPLEVVNDLTGWQVIQAKINAGVPVEVALEEAGYDSDQVDSWLKDATGADLGRRVALLNQIGTAVQTIGAGIALGAVSKEAAQQVILGVLKLTLEGTDVQVPEDGEYVDPQAALKAQQALAAGQQQHQQTLQQNQLDHASKTQETAQQFQARMAQEAHQRMQENLRAGGALPPGRQPGGPGDRGQPGPKQGRPIGGQRPAKSTPAKKA